MRKYMCVYATETPSNPVEKNKEKNDMAYVTKPMKFWIAMHVFDIL
jgi:hypothetical protein